ncbi:MAG: putative Ig domain-containing protein, partial [Oleiphilaceae bacterium]|nr:putative Ig domain-containing protein [Oleiphilaceae bacterium]
VGTISVEVTAEDSAGATASDVFELTVANSNDDPSLDNAIADQSATEDSAFSFTFAANTFGDVDAGDTLTYTAQLAGGGALPGWLSFDPMSRTFSGTPANGDVGTISVLVTAEDSAGATVSDTFDITVANVNDAPSGVLTVDGVLAEDETLTANTSALVDEDGLGALSYQWYRDGAAISGATSVNYTLTQDDVGAQISYRVDYVDARGSSEQLFSGDAGPIANVDDPLTGQVLINGQGVLNTILAADTSALADDDGIASLSYQWLRDGVAISGANASLYTVAIEDAGKSITLRVTVNDAQGNTAQITSDALAVQAIIELPETPVSAPPPAEVKPTPAPINETAEPEKSESQQETNDEAENEAEEDNTEEELVAEENTSVFEDQASFIDRDGFELELEATTGIDRNIDFVGQSIDVRNIDVLTGELASIAVTEEEAAYQPGITDINSVNDPLFLVRSNGFLKGLDNMRDRVNESADVTQAVVGSSLAVSAGMSAGYVAWLARSGVLLSSVISSLPVWRFVDPLPILTNTGGAAGGDGESLESLVAGGEGAAGAEGTTQNNNEAGADAKA